MWLDEMPRTERLRGFECAVCGATTVEQVSNGMCPRCWSTGTLVAHHERLADALLPDTPGITARELARRDQSLFEVSAYPGLKLARDALVVPVGPPGGGKTTMGLRLAEALQPSVFAACETGIGPALAETLRRLEIRSPSLWIEEPKSVRRLVQLANRDIRCLVIDSVNMTTLLPEDLVGLARGFGVVVVAICQVRKDGLPAGTNRLQHAADVVIEVEKLRWCITKSRFQAKGEGEVLSCASVSQPNACSA